MKKLFFLSFVEEMIQNPDFFAYVGGRIEVYDDKSEFNIEEIRFLTKKKKEFYQFREKWDFEDISEKELKEIRRIVKKNFCEKV